MSENLKLEEERRRVGLDSPENRFLRFEEEQKEKLAWAKERFDIDKLVDKTNKVKEIVIIGVGLTKYKDLTAEEMFALSREADSENMDRYDLGVKIAAIMLKKADKKVTEAKLRNLSPRYLRPLVEGLAADFLG